VLRPDGPGIFLDAARASGLSLEGLVVAIVASWRGQVSMVPGVAFGIVLVALAGGVGAAAMAGRVPLPAPDVEALLLPAVPLAAIAFALTDQTVSRGEGLALIAVYAAFVLLPAFGKSGDDHPPPADRAGRGPSGPALSGLLGMALGVGGAYLGARVLIAGGIRVAERAGLLAGFVGAAIVGPGASARTVVGVARRPSGEHPPTAQFVAITAFGAGALGAAAFVRPLVVDGAAAEAFVAAVAIYALTATVFLGRGRAGRLTGLAVIALYGLWIALSSMT